MFWTCDENSVDNTGMFALLLSSAYTESRFLLLLTPPCQRVGLACTRSWERTQSGQLTPTDQRDIPDYMTACSAIERWGKKKEEGDVQSDGVCLPESPLHVMEPCFPGDG